MGWACHVQLVWVGPANMQLFLCGLIQAFACFGCRLADMSGSEHRTALPPEVPCYSQSRRSTTSAQRDGLTAHSCDFTHSSSESPERQQGSSKFVNKRRRRSEQVRQQASPTRNDVPDWQVVLKELASLKGAVTKLTEKRELPSPQQRVNYQASTSGIQAPGSPEAFSGFVDSGSEDGEITEAPHAAGSSVLLQAAKAFGPLDVVSEDINPQVATMVNFWFKEGLQEDDYKAIMEDPITRRPNNCPALCPVDCNPQILAALKTDAKRNDSRLKDVSNDIIAAGSIITKSLLELDKVAQGGGDPVVAQEIGRINGALALLGHATHRTNLARRLVLKREINQKYAHLCSDKVPLTKFLFGDDVSQSAKQIEDAEKLKNKIAPKKNFFPWKPTSGRARSFWGKQGLRSQGQRFQPYTQQRWSYRGGQRQYLARQEVEPKNSKGRGHPRPRQ